MRYLHWFCFSLSSVLLCACATPPAPDLNPQRLNNAPDLSAFRNAELSTNGKRKVIPARFVADGAYLELLFPGAGSEYLYVQVEECRNDGDAFCSRRYVVRSE